MKKILTSFLLIVMGLPAVLFSQNSKMFLTVYNQNLALVKEIRTVTLTRSNPYIALSNFPNNIIPASVVLESLNDGKQFSVLEQVYEYDVLNSNKLLRKYIGKEIQIFDENGNLIKGILLRFLNDQLILKTEQGIRIVPRNEKQQILLKELPKDFVTRPTLRWEVANFRKTKQKLSISYLTTGMSWQSEYTAQISEKGDYMTFSGWVSIRNESGTSYRNAQLRLVAGEIHRIGRSPTTPYVYESKAMAAKVSATQFQEKPISEYYAFSLQRPFSIQNNQSKQISLFPPTSVSITKKFIYNSNIDPRRVLTSIEFLNSKENHLGLPLPAGTVRIYKAVDQSLEFLGEDRLKHTPKNEKIELFIGKAFDITARRTLLERKKISQRAEIQKIQIQFKNHKDTDIEIQVKEHLQQPNWEIVNSSHRYQKVSVSECDFFVPVKKGETTTLTYQVRYIW